MTSARTASPHPGSHGPPRQDCRRCGNLWQGRVSATGPQCPRCKGRGLEPLPRAVAAPRTPDQQAILDELRRLADLRDRMDSDFDIAELNAGPIAAQIVAAHEAGLAARYIGEALRLSRQRVHQIQHGLRKGERLWK